MDDTIANYWEGEWEDRVTGADMAGRGVATSCDCM
jgi:hypothetical protein